MKEKHGRVWGCLCQAHWDRYDAAVDAAVKNPSDQNVRAMLAETIRANRGRIF